MLTCEINSELHVQKLNYDHYDTILSNATVHIVSFPFFELDIVSRKNFFTIYPLSSSTDDLQFATF